MYGERLLLTMDVFSMIFVKLFLVVCCLQNIKGQHANRLDKYIRHYEGLSYDTEALHQRSLVKDKTLQLGFRSHGRYFNLQLKRDNSSFSPHLTIAGSGEDLPLDIDYIDFIYTGQALGENGTVTHGSVVDGRFQGSIQTHQGTYYVEPAERYFKGRNVSFHSVVYHEDDISDPEGGYPDHSVLERMRTYQASAVDHPVSKPLAFKAKSRATLWGTCELLIQTDHYFTEYYGTKRNVMFVINSFVKDINSIYQTTDFGGIRYVNFVVKRIIINTTSDTNDVNNPFRFPNIGVEKYLNLFSQQNHNDYCLAYVFTNRDFDGGVLGLAWRATLNTAVSRGTGGICDEHRLFSDMMRKSLNTGLVTVKNYGQQVPLKVSLITFAHEVGHNFGSPHDETPSCAPGMAQGNYIMYPHAPQGERPNNRRFSPCSIDAMSMILKERMKKCFVENVLPICGNGILEKGEECDCGFRNECEEQCCYNADENVGKRCKLKPGKACSPSQGSCCHKDECHLIPQGKRCRPESGCVHESLCNGTHVQCPPSQFKEDFITTCDTNTKVCLNGVCTGSICLKFGLESCTCPSPEGMDEKAMQCRVCCMEPTEPDTCSSTGSEKWAHFFRRQHMTLKPGSPCNDLKGYCDVYFKCRPVNASGPLSWLLRYLFNPEMYKTIAEWIVTYWWAVLVMGIVYILLMAGLVRTCSFHTPSSNPKLPLPSGTSRRGQPQSQG